MIHNTGLLLDFNLTRNVLSIVSIKLKCCQYNKEVYCYCPISSTISLKPIQSSFVPIKPREDSDKNLVGTWTLKCTRWNRTTEKIISPILDILYLVTIDNLTNVCSLLLVLIKCELITCEISVLFWLSLFSENW